MDLKKVEKKNPGWVFSQKISKRASKTVLDAATQTDLDIDSYNMKYAKQIKSKKALADTPGKTKLNDKKWRMMKKESKNKSTDSPEEPKAGFFDDEGNEVASQG
jgi:hypothetical protein